MSNPDTDPQQSTDGGATGVPPYESSPFTDWREQLRDRVKEIRARKLADKRRGEDSLAEELRRDAENSRQRDKIQAARHRAAEASTEAHEEAWMEGTAPSEPELEAEHRAPAELEPDADEAEELVAAARDALESIQAGGWEPAEDTHVDEVHEARETDDDEPHLDELSLSDDTDSEDADTNRAAPAPRETRNRRENTMKPESLPSWWRSEETPSDDDESHPAPPADLEAIPDDLRNANIPSWALPRRRAESAPVPAATETAGSAGSGELPESDSRWEEERNWDDDEWSTDADADAADQEDATLEADDEAPAEDLDDLATAALESIEEPVRLPWEDLAGDDPTPANAAPAESYDDPMWSAMSASPPQAPAEGAPKAPAAAALPRERPKLDDVYLVGEFSTRKPGESAPSRAPLEVDEVDPLEALREASRRKAASHLESVSADKPRRPIPNLHESDDDTDVEAAPSPFRGLLDEDDVVEHEELKVTAEGLDRVWEDTLEDELDDDAPSPEVDPTAPLADRLFSSLADGLVVALLGLLLGVSGAAAAGTSVPAFVGAAPVPFLLAWLLFALVYGVFFVGTCGQTVGKMVMRVRVIGADRFEVGYATAARRALLYLLSAVPAGLGLLPAINDPEHRALHDRFSGTRVVKA